MNVKIIDASSPEKSSILKISPGITMMSLKNHIINQEFSREKKDKISDLRFLHDISDMTQEKLIKNASITEEKDSTKPNYFDEKYNDKKAYNIFSKNNILCFYYLPIFLKLKITIKSKDYNFISIMYELHEDKNDFNSLKKYLSSKYKYSPDKIFLFVNDSQLSIIDINQDLVYYQKTGIIAFIFPIKLLFKYNNTKKVIEINDDKPLKFYEKVIKKQFHLEDQNIEYKIGQIIPSDLSIHSIIDLFDYHYDNIKIKSFKGSNPIVLCIQVVGIDGSFKKFKVSFFPERKIKKIKKHLIFNRFVPSEYIDSAFFTIQNGKKIVILDENQCLSDYNIRNETIITCYAKDRYIIKYKDDNFPFYEKELTYEQICLIIQSKYNIQKDDDTFILTNDIILEEHENCHKFQNGTKFEVYKKNKLNITINYKKDKINISIENSSPVQKINYLLRKQFGSEYLHIRFVDNENNKVLIPEYLILVYFGDDDTKTYEINAEVANEYTLINMRTNKFYTKCLLSSQTFFEIHKEIKVAWPNIYDDHVYFVYDERVLEFSDKLNEVYDIDSPICIYNEENAFRINLTFYEKGEKHEVQALFMRNVKVMYIRLYASKIMSIENENDIILYDTKDNDRQLDDDNEELYTYADNYYLNAKVKEKKS